VLLQNLICFGGGHVEDEDGTVRRADGHVLAAAAERGPRPIASDVELVVTINDQG